MSIKVEKRFILIVVSVMFHSSAMAWFEHDRAIQALRSGDAARASSLLTSLVTDYPEDPEVLYDAGVVAYKKGEYVQAAAYFSSAVEYALKNESLKERAHFNAGNSCAKTGKFQEAIEHYTNALKINSTSEHARHNLEQVKKMLEQQKEKDQNQQHADNKSTQDSENNQQKKQQQSDNTQKEGSPNQDKSNQQNDQKDQKKSDQGSSNEQFPDKESQQGNDGDSGKQKSQNEGEKDRESKDNQKNNQQPAGQTDHASNDHPGNQHNPQKKQGDQEPSGHNNPQNKSMHDEQQRESNNTVASVDGKKKENVAYEKEGPQQSNKQDGLEGVEPWLAQILREQELNDAKSNKELLLHTIGAGAAKDNTNGW
jgi:tetratricopeptide (TPR) repeat protein